MNWDELQVNWCLGEAEGPSGASGTVTIKEFFSDFPNDMELKVPFAIETSRPALIAMPGDCPAPRRRKARVGRISGQRSDESQARLDRDPGASRPRAHVPGGASSMAHPPGGEMMRARARGRASSLRS